jgi:serine/threonine-protein kinase
MIAAEDRPIVGTLAYMAPEMLVAKLPVDIRADLYSLGASLFEWLTGQLPFEGHSAAELVAQHRQELPADLRGLAPHLPTRVAQLVRRLLAKEPLRRPQSPRELVDALAALEIETFDERAPL